MKSYVIALLTVLVMLSVNSLYSARPKLMNVYYDQTSRQHLDTFGDQLAERFGLCHILSGSGPLIDSYDVLWSLGFTSNKALTIEEVRPLVLQLADSLWQFAEQDPAFSAYLEESNKKKPLHRGYFGFKLAFWDAHVNRPLPPYVAQVILSGNEVLYFYADPKTQALLPPIKEPLESTNK